MRDGTATSGKDCRAEFKATATRYRAISRPLLVLALLGVCLLVLCWSGRYREIGVGGFVVCWAIGFIGSFLLPKIVCPACHKEADQEIDQFCPECGSPGLDGEYGLFSVTRCDSCCKKLLRGKGGRRYKIRFCTFCGAQLDESGV
jgi:hypothetical protein